MLNRLPRTFNAGLLSYKHAIDMIGTRNKRAFFRIQARKVATNSHGMGWPDPLVDRLEKSGFLVPFLGFGMAN